MILRRLGNKSKLAEKLQQYFPKHTTYIEPFFGAGGMFFNKPKAKYNIVNDSDSEVFNLFMTVKSNKEALKAQWLKTPISEDLWNYWKTHKETEPVMRAIRFLLFSNFGYMGKPDTLRLEGRNAARQLYDMIDKTYQMLFGVEFMNTDFRKLFNKISLEDQNRRQSTFVYTDPPYLDTDNNYQQGFTQKDSYDLFDCLEQSGCRWAMSEFDHPYILKQAKARGLYIHTIGERRALNNRRAEILITNYQKMQATLF
ncbi:MAG: DNA adenine methylase [Bacteroidota bacterium]